MNKVYKQHIKMIAKRVINEALRNRIVYYVVDDGGVYNYFPSDLFDEQGNYIVDPSININDMDIVKTFGNEAQAFKYTSDLNDGYITID